MWVPGRNGQSAPGNRLNEPEDFAEQLKAAHLKRSKIRANRSSRRSPSIYKGQRESYYSYCRTHHLHSFGKQRLVINYRRADLSTTLPLHQQSLVLQAIGITAFAVIAGRGSLSRGRQGRRAGSSINCAASAPFNAMSLWWRWSIAYCVPPNTTLTSRKSFSTNSSSNWQAAQRPGASLTAQALWCWLLHQLRSNPRTLLTADHGSFDPGGLPFLSSAAGRRLLPHLL